jgi:Domain of unknown function (DUF4296)
MINNQRAFITPWHRKIARCLSSFLGFSFLMLFSNLFFSCSNNRAQPEGILSIEQMTVAMTEFYIRESKINSLHVSQDSALILFQEYIQKYSEDKNIPDSLMELSYQYYLGKPNELNEIYDRIIDSLALKEQRTNAIQKKPE